MSHIGNGTLTAENYPPFAEMLATDGFIYNYWRCHWPRPDVMEAKIQMVSRLFKDGALDRRRKEYIAVAVAGRLQSTYCATAHAAILKAMGIGDADLDQLGVDHHLLDLPEADVAMLDFAVKLTENPAAASAADVARLRDAGFTDPQIFEIVFMTSLMNLASRLSLGLGAVPDPRNVEKAPVFVGAVSETAASAAPPAPGSHRTPRA